MKKLFTLLTFLVFTHFFGLSQNVVNWDWTNVFTGTGDNFASNIAVDSLDNVYVLGTFTDSLFIGSDTLVSYGSSDLYVSKFNSEGDLLWYKQLGSVNGDAAGQITTDKQGNMYLFAFGSTGNYFIGDQDTLTDCVSYILKLSPTGNVLAKKQINGNPNRIINIQTDKYNNVYGAVDIGDSLVIGDSVLRIPLVVGSFYSEIFKLDELLNCTWIKKSFTSGCMQGAICNFATDIIGNTYTALTLTGDTDFGDGVQVSIPSTDLSAFVIVKYNTNNQCLWAKQITHSSNGLSQASNVGLDKYDGLYLSGLIVGTTYIGDSVFYDETMSQMGNGFIAKYDTAGNFKWVNNVHSNMDGFDFCVDYSFGINNWGYMTGVFNDTLFIGNDTLYGTHTDLSTSSYLANSAFISKIDTSGNIIKSYYAGEIGMANINTNSLGDLFVAGYNRPSGGKSTTDSYKSFSAGLLAPRLPLIQISGNDTICLGSAIGNLSLPSTGLSINKWQKSFNNQTWEDINVSTNNYSEVPLSAGFWSYRAEVQLAGDMPNFTNPVMIDVITKPEASFSHTLSGLELSCTSTSVNSDSSVWIWGDGTRTETTQNVSNHVYSEINQYSVTLISYNDCGSDSTTVTVEITKVDHNYTYYAKIECFPNPTSGLVNVKISKYSLNSPIKAKIVSLIGEVVFESSLSKETSVIDLKSLPKGIYYLVLEGDRITQTEKIIKL